MIPAFRPPARNQKPTISSSFFEAARLQARNDTCVGEMCSRGEGTATTSEVDERLLSRPSWKGGGGRSSWSGEGGGGRSGENFIDGGTGSFLQPVLSSVAEAESLAQELQLLGVKPPLQTSEENFAKYRLIPMAFGKSKILSPILNLFLLHRGFLPVLLMPPALYSSTKLDLQAELAPLRVEVAEFLSSASGASAASIRQMSADDWKIVYERIRVQILGGNVVVVAQPFQIRALDALEEVLHAQLETLRKQASAGMANEKAKDEILKKLSIVHRLIQLLRSRGHLILDEMDSLMTVGHTVVLPTGRPVSLRPFLVKMVVRDWFLGRFLAGVLMGGAGVISLQHLVRLLG